MKRCSKEIQVLTFILIVVLLILIGTLTVKAIDVPVVYDGNQLTTFKNRTKEEIGLQYSNSMGYDTTYRDDDSNTWYEEKASTQYPYNPGKLTSDTHKVMTDTVNYFRWLVGAKPLSVVSQHSDALQAGALVRNKQFEHEVTIPKPDDMDQDLWNLGVGADHNILARFSTPRGAITSWLNEGYSLYSEEFGVIGHRTTLIDSNTSNLQFGYAGSIAIGNQVASSNKTNLPYYAFPAPGYMPLNHVSVNTSAWSIELNTNTIVNTDESKVCVTVTNLNTKEKYECTKANGKLSSSIGFLMFAQPTSSNDSGRYGDGDKFKIEVTGLQDKTSGNSAQIVYTTEFFNVAEYAPTIAVGACAPGGYTNIIIKQADNNKLQQVAAILPTTIKVETDNGRNIELPLKKKWVLDTANTCWTNSIDSSDLPDYLKDPDKVLDNIKITYEIDPQDGSNLSKIGSSTVEGNEGHLLLWRYMSGCNNYELHQVVSDSNNGYKGIKRYDQDDGISFYEETGYLDFPLTYQLSDTGTYYAIYWSSTFKDDAYLAGGVEITVTEKQVKSIAVEAPSKNTYKVGENLNLENGKITVTYEDSTTAIIELTDEMVSNFSSATKGLSTVTVTYRGKKATFNVLVVGNPDKVNAVYGNTLADVTLPSDEYGTYT